MKNKKSDSILNLLDVNRLIDDPDLSYCSEWCLRFAKRHPEDSQLALFLGFMAGARMRDRQRGIQEATALIKGRLGGKR